MLDSSKPAGGFDMERIYVKIWYLKALHFFFFSFAVFSMTSGIMFFNFAAMESLSFFFLGSFYCISSLIIAYYYYRDYKETLEPMKVIRVYFVPYIVLVFWTILSVVFLVWTFPSLLLLIQSFLFVNYYVFFFIITGFVLSRFNVVSRLFDMYNALILMEAMAIAREYACFVDVGEYSIGSNPEMDEILDEIWVRREYPLLYVRKFEIAICEKHVIDINRMLNMMREKVSESDKGVMESIEKIKDDYLRKIKEIKQKTD